MTKRCACCSRRYDQASWDRLKLLGYQTDDECSLELRNCVCGATLSIQVLLDPQPAHVAEAPTIPPSYFWPPMFFCRRAETPST